MTILASRTFNTAGEYAAALSLSGDASHEHEAAGGWDGSGCGKFVPATNVPGGGDCGIALYTFGIADGRRRSIRCCFFYGSQFAENLTQDDKVLIVNRDTGNNAHRFISRLHPGGGDRLGKVDLEACNNTLCGTPAAPFSITEFEEQWLSFEWDCNLDAGTATVYIATRDGVYNGVTPYTTLTLLDTTGNWGGGGNILGGFFNSSMTAHASCYFKMDDLVIADTYIGPPAGFATDPWVPCRPFEARTLS